MLARLSLWLLAKVGPKVIKKISPAVRLEIIKWVVKQESVWIETPNRFDDLLPPLFVAVFKITQDEILEAANLK